MKKIKSMPYEKNSIFSYDENKKLLLHLSFISGFILLIILILYYIFSFRISENLIANLINSFFSHIYTNLRNTTLIGALYTTLFGGLFFVFVPIEIIFITFLSSGINPLLIILFFLTGFIISYTLNYEIGMRLNNISKKVITIKKFYKIKSILNRYGVYTILFFNLLPLPSQPLSAILGVFKYSRKKFYIFFILGQLTKLSIITLGYIYIV